jgi:hypothetical protein
MGDVSIARPCAWKPALLARDAPYAAVSSAAYFTSLADAASKRRLLVGVKPTSADCYTQNECVTPRGPLTALPARLRARQVRTRRRLRAPGGWAWQPLQCRGRSAPCQATFPVTGIGVPELGRVEFGRVEFGRVEFGRVEFGRGGPERAVASSGGEYHAGSLPSR